MVVPLPRAAWHDRFTSSRALLWLAPCLVLAPSSILAQDFQSPEPITAAVIQDWPPYYIVGPDGRPAGLAVDLLDAVQRGPAWFLAIGCTRPSPQCRPHWTRAKSMSFPTWA